MKVAYCGDEDEMIVLPIGCCLEVVINDGYMVIAKLPERYQFDDTSFQMDDPRVAFATQEEFNACGAAQ